MQRACALKYLNPPFGRAGAQALSIAGYALDALVQQTNAGQNATNQLRMELVPSIRHPLFAGVDLVSGGHNYLPGDIRIFDNGTEISGYNATFITSSTGRILQVFARTFGDNYTLSPSATALAFFSSSDVTQDHRVGTIEILDPGSGHTDGTYSLLVQCNLPSCKGSGFSASYNVSGGMVVATSIVNRGEGYTLSAPSVYVQCAVQPSYGADCVPASLITKVPSGATLKFVPPFTRISGLRGLQGPPTGRIAVSSFLNDATLVYGSEADWDLEEGHLTLHLRRPARNGTRYGLAIDLLNPARGQSAVHPRSSGRAGFVFAVQLLRRGSGNSAPLLVCNVSRASISQDNAGQGQVNTLTVVFELTASILKKRPLTSITISGLTGTAEPSQANLSVSNPAYVLTTWHQPTGTLITHVDADLLADRLHNFSFQVTNGVRYRAPANVTIASSDFFLSMPMAVGEGNSAPLRVVGFVESAIAQSTASAGALNRVTISLKSSSSIDARLFDRDTKLVVTGLKGSQTLDTSSLAIADLSGQVHRVFGQTASWKQAAGALILSVQTDVPGGQDLVLEIELVNPASPQDSRAVSLEATSGLVILPIAVAAAPGLAQPLLVAGFAYALISQSTPSQGDANTLTVSLSCNFPLLNNETSVITIAGLTGSQTIGDSYLPLSGPNASMFGDGTGWSTHKAFWRHGRQIEFQVEAEAPAKQVFSAAFVLQNPSGGQASPDVSIRASGKSFATPWQAVAKGAGNAAPLLIAAFTFASIGQSNAKPADRNTVTVTVATNCELGGGGQGARLHIDGLGNASWGTGLVTLMDKSNDLVALTHGAATGSRRLSVAIASNTSRLLAGRLYAFQFNLTNPSEVQGPARVFFSVDGAVKIGQAEAHTPAGIDAILRVFSFATVTGSCLAPFAIACLADACNASDIPSTLGSSPKARRAAHGPRSSTRSAAFAFAFTQMTSAGNLSGASTRWSLQSSNNSGMEARRGFGAVFIPGEACERPPASPSPSCQAQTHGLLVASSAGLRRSRQVKGIDRPALSANDGPLTN